MHCASRECLPTGSTSWCKCQQDKANRTSLYKHGPGLPLQFIAKVKPEYVKLSDDTLLEKCLHGKTQNRNKALNGMVPQRIHKEVYVGRKILEVGLYGAVAHFNIGTSPDLKLLNALGISPGKFTEIGRGKQDQAPVHLAQRRAKRTGKKRRKVQSTLALSTPRH